MNDNRNQTDSRPPMALLATLNGSYICRLCVMLSSLRRSNPNERLHVYILHTSLTDEHLQSIRAVLNEQDRLFPIRIDPSDFAGAPTTDRYPPEMYYRLFAAEYLPESLDRILYLDPDIIVKGSLRELYDTAFDGRMLAAASHVGKMMTRFNSARLDAKRKTDPYINSGVMLLNLRRLRKNLTKQEIYAYIDKHRKRLILPDQDIISGLYGPEILLIDPYRYNMTERLFALRVESEAWRNLEWVKKNTVIVHYCGRNKPWKPGYAGVLDVFYREEENALKAMRLFPKLCET